jgi:hypothetical protein
MAARPAWQQDDCPAWCVVVHRDDDHPHDQKHISAVRAVPVVQLCATGPNGADARKAAELVVVLQRRDGTTDTWLYVGDGDTQSIEVSPDCWRRLLGQLNEVLTYVDHS